MKKNEEKLRDPKFDYRSEHTVKESAQTRDRVARHRAKKKWDEEYSFYFPTPEDMEVAMENQGGPDWPSVVRVPKKSNSKIEDVVLYFYLPGRKLFDSMMKHLRMPKK